MALTSSGEISLGGTTAGRSVNLELGQAAGATITMNDTNLRSLFGVASGQISMSSGYGKSSQFSTGIVQGSGTAGTPRGVGIVSYSFTTDTPTTETAVLSGGQSEGGGTNTPAFGYSHGGTRSPTTTKGDIYRWTFGSRTSALIAATMKLVGPASSGGRQYTGAVNSTTRGYVGGGRNESPLASPQFSEIDGLIFSTEAAIDPAAALAQARFFISGTNSSTTGYFHGGHYITGFIQTGQIDGITFSTEAAVNPAASLVQARGAGGSNSSGTKGYVGGGYSAPVSSAPVTQIDGILFSTEAAIDPAAGLATAFTQRANHQGMHSSTSGYFHSGPTSTKINFSTETTASCTPTGVAAGTAFQNSPN